MTRFKDVEELRAYRRATKEHNADMRSRAWSPGPGWVELDGGVWRTELLGSDLHYWPSTKSWRWRDVHASGEVERFMEAQKRRAEWRR